MNDFELCKAIRKHTLDTAAQCVAYSSWSADFVKGQLLTCKERLEKSKNFRKINLKALTKRNLKELGFGLWSDNSNLYLIPLWLLPYLEEATETESISGSKHSTTSDIDNDSRMGCLAYGIKPTK